MTWIDATRRLPTHVHSVLGVITGGGMTIKDETMIDIVVYIPRRRIWLQYVGVDSGVDPATMDNESDAIVSVSHWMELPEPPRA